MIIAALSSDRFFSESCIKAFRDEKVNVFRSYPELQERGGVMPEDVAIVDINNVAPFDLTKLKCNLLVVTGVPKFAEAVRLMQFGIRGYGNRAMHPDNMRQAVSAVRSGQVWMPPFIISRLITSIPAGGQEHAEELPELSDREMQVAKLVAAGRANKEIAEDMDITVRTVKAHLTSIFNKTGLRDRVAVAIRFK